MQRVVKKVTNKGEILYLSPKETTAERDFYATAANRFLAMNESYLSPGGSGGLHWRVMLGQIPGHVAHEPLKVLAAQSAPELFLGRHVSSRQVSVLRPALVYVLGVLVHPHLCHPLQVLDGKSRQTGDIF